MVFNGIWMHLCLIERHRQRCQPRSAVIHALNARPHGRRPRPRLRLRWTGGRARGLQSPLPRIPLHHDLMRPNLNGGQRATAKRINPCFFGREVEVGVRGFLGPCIRPGSGKLLNQPHQPKTSDADICREASLFFYP